MDINFNGFNENVITLQADSSVTKGCTVKMKTSGVVEKAGEGDRFCGVCLNVREGIAAIQLTGYTELKLTGSGVTPGYHALVSSGDGVMSSQDGSEYLVLCVDSEKVGLIL